MGERASGPVCDKAAPTPMTIRGLTSNSEVTCTTGGVFASPNVSFCVAPPTSMRRVAHDAQGLFLPIAEYGYAAKKASRANTPQPRCVVRAPTCPCHGRTFGLFSAVSLPFCGTLASTDLTLGTRRTRLALLELLGLPRSPHHGTSFTRSRTSTIPQPRRVVVRYAAADPNQLHKHLAEEQRVFCGQGG